MNCYDPQSCNPLAKVFYRPIEAAIRWCGLIDEAPMILDTVGDNLLPKPCMFPDWPCLVANCERIVHALQNGDLPQARNGVRTGPNDHVTPAKLTVLHTDLKAWMTTHFPDQRPPFLFDEIERATHRAINADSFRALQADRDAARAELRKANQWWDEHAPELELLKAERDALRAMVEPMRRPSDQAITGATYGRLLAALNAFDPSNPPRSKKAFQSELETLDCDTREQEVFARIVAEHFGHDWRN